MPDDSTPPDWYTATFAEDVDLISGQHIQASDYSSDIHGTPYLTGPTDFPNGRIIISKYTKSPKAMCAKGDLLLTVKGSGTGKPTRADRPYCISRQLMALRPRSWEREFIFQILLASQSRFGNEASGLIPGLSREQILSTPVLIPPLSEQRKIAAILSSVDDTIEKTQAVIDQLEVVKKGLLGELLARGMPGRHSRYKTTPIGEIPENWACVPLASALERIDTGWSPLCDLQPAQPGEWGVLKISSVTWGEFRPEENKRLPLGVDPRPEAEVHAGDLLVSRANTKELVGRAVLVKSTPPRLMASDKLLRLRPNPQRAIAIFLNYVLSTATSRAQIGNAASGSSGSMKNISQEKLRGILVPLPTVDEQNDIVSVLDSTSVRLQQERAALDGLRDLKSALLRVLLSGELRVACSAQEAA